MSHKSLKHKVIIFCFLLTGFCFLPSAVFAQAVSSNELIVEAKRFDNKEVAYEGELVGSLLQRGDFVWLNLNDGDNAIGVWAERGMAQHIRHAGGYGVRGDWIGVRGVFHRSCLEHGGGLDIHAQESVLLKDGAAVPQALSHKKILMFIFLLGVLACLLIIHILAMRRNKA